MLFAWFFPEEAGRGMTWTTVAVLVCLAVVGEIIEFGAGAAGAAKQGASRRAIALSMLGAMLGSIFGLATGAPIPVLGSFVMAVLGGAAGAFAGAYLGEAWKGRPGAERVAAGTARQRRLDAAGAAAQPGAEAASQPDAPQSLPVIGR